MRYEIQTTDGLQTVDGWPVEYVHGLAITEDPEDPELLRVTHVLSGWAVSPPWAHGAEELDDLLHQAWTSTGSKREDLMVTLALLLKPNGSLDVTLLRQQYGELRSALLELGGGGFVSSNPARPEQETVS